MAMVERLWFQQRFNGEDMPDPWASLDWDSDVDAEMTRAQSLSAAELFDEFDAAVADSRARVARASSLEQLSVLSKPDAGQWNLRWILIHMIEEYARHCGHADLIRESIDGDVLG